MRRMHRDFLKRLLLAVGPQRRDHRIGSQNVIQSHGVVHACLVPMLARLHQRHAFRKSANSCRGVNPADIPVPAAVYDIDATVASVSENHHRRAGHIQLGDRIANAQIMQAAG
jgi:hypothetical protein